MQKCLKEHIDNIKNKIEVIKAHNKKLIILNYKLESFIICLDTFSIEENEQTRVESKRKIEKNKFLESQNIEKKESIIDFTQMRQEREIRAPKASKMITSPIVYTPSKLNTLNVINLGESIHNASLLSEYNSPLQNDLRFNELLSRVTSNSQGKINKMHIIKILGMLNKSNGMLLDDVIKKSGMSKYKCIDVLNILLKTEPPTIRKKFDKGFIYFINYD